MLLRLAAGAVGGVFLYAGTLKTLNPAAFALDVQNYRLLPWTACVLVALYLPWLEIVCGLALVVKRAYRPSLLLLIAMMLVFMGALVSANARGLDIACGCFGTPEKPGVFPEMLLRDLVILAALVGLLVMDWRVTRTSRLSGPGDRSNPD